MELTDRQRSKLLELAARRGEKGFSRLVQEAVDRYLVELEERERDARTQAAIAVLGTLDDETAEAMRETSCRLRRDWQC